MLDEKTLDGLYRIWGGIRPEDRRSYAAFMVMLARYWSVGMESDWRDAAMNNLCEEEWFMKELPEKWRKELKWYMDLETDDLAGMVEGWVKSVVENVFCMFSGRHLDESTKFAMLDAAERMLMSDDIGTAHVRTEHMPDDRLYVSFDVFTVKEGVRSDYRAHYWICFRDDTLVAEKGW